MASRHIVLAIAFLFAIRLLGNLPIHPRHRARSPRGQQLPEHPVRRHRLASYAPVANGPDHVAPRLESPDNPVEGRVQIPDECGDSALSIRRKPF